MRVRLAVIVALAIAFALAGAFFLKQNPVRVRDLHPEIELIPPEMAEIPAGRFTMGDDARGRPIERPAHEVLLTAYRIGKFEVTNAEWKRFCDATGHACPADPDFAEANPLGKDYFLKNPHYPVVMISWNDMAAYCRWLSGRTGKDYHLPTEAQWERAARGGLSGMDFPWGNERDSSRARVFLHWNEGPVAVGSYAPNGFGLYDMAGNVNEATADWFDESAYARAPSKDPVGPSGLVNYVSLVAPWQRSRLKGRCHVVRGGSYRAPWDALTPGPDGRLENSSQVFCRDWLYQQPYVHFDLGFRVAEGGVH